MWSAGRSRHLAAVLCADVSGYSRLMGKDEEGTYRRVQDYVREVLLPNVRQQNGRVVKTAGDGFFCEFPSAVQAIRCALKFQRRVLESESGQDPSQRIDFRIGIHLGDIISEKGDLFGDDVNIAARLESECEPGGLCVSGRVQGYIAQKLQLPFIDLGERHLKNISNPVRLFALGPAVIQGLPEQVFSAGLEENSWFWRALAPMSRASILAGAGLLAAPFAVWLMVGHLITTDKAKLGLSLVVLPFEDLSSTPQESIADGLTDNLTSDLATHLPKVLVIARNTAFTYKGRLINARKVGAELGVRYVLEGSIQQSGEGVRVNAQFIDAVSGAHIWAERFDVDRKEIFKAQDLITGRIANSLSVKLYALEAQEAQRRDMGSPEVLGLLVRGKAAIDRPQTVANLLEAEDLFRRALEIDPQSSDAMLGIAAAAILRIKNFMRSGAAFAEIRQAQLREADQLIDKAAQAAPKWLWHNVRGLRYSLDGRFAQAAQEYETALSLNQNYAAAYGNLAGAYLQLGEPEKIPDLMNEALRRSPIDNNRGFWFPILGQAELLLSRYDAAVESFEKARAISPQNFTVLAGLAAAHANVGRMKAAAVALDEARAIEPWLSIDSFRRTFGAEYQRRAEGTFYKGLRQAGLGEVPPPTFIVEAVVRAREDGQPEKSTWMSLELYLDGEDRFRSRESLWSGEPGRSGRTWTDTQGRFGQINSQQSEATWSQTGQWAFVRTVHYPTHIVVTQVAQNHTKCEAKISVEGQAQDGRLVSKGSKGELINLSSLQFEKVTCRSFGAS
jgi:adenylate cyclase